MEIENTYIKVQKTARVATLGKLSDKTKYLWLAIHGSNMVAEQMLYKFENFDLDEHFIVAPEALNRFYAEGFGGDVVAAWMTKRDRLKEIEDYSFYLTTVLNQYKSIVGPECKTIILGFSQGGTTMFRWLHAQKLKLDSVLAYSCWIPEDIDLDKSATNLNSLEINYTYGLQDHFLTEERINAMQTVIERNHLNIQIHPYDGQHRIEKIQLKKRFDEFKFVPI